jgi:hypothetical protein
MRNESRTRTTGHFVRGATRREEILLTDGTVAPVLAGLAVVTFVQIPVNAHAALMAVLEVFPAPHATKAAIGTVVRRLFVRHPQVADVAVVRAKDNAAGYAVIGFAALTGIALTTDYLTNGESINGVIVVFWCHVHTGEGTGEGGTAMKAFPSIVDFGWPVVGKLN